MEEAAGRLDRHPTVVRVRARAATVPAVSEEPLEADWLYRLCLEAGADDAGFVELERPEIADQRADILAAFPHARTLVSFVCRMNRENIRTPARSVANLEFHVPDNPLWRRLWWMYTRVAMPILGGLVARPWFEVGRFLGPSISRFYDRHPLEEQLAMWRVVGVADVQARVMSLGAGVVIWGTIRGDHARGE